MTEAGEPGEARGARTRLAGGRSRLMAVVWLGVLGGTIGFGVLGQARPGADTVAPEVGAVVPSPAPIRPAVQPPVQPAVRPAATRPPIGEDGVMGGLPFGPAWLWREPKPEAGRGSPSD